LSERAISDSSIQHDLSLFAVAIDNQQSTFGNSDTGREHAILSVFSWVGGIAQLVERQLCKLDVRGSNPLASKSSDPPFASAVDRPLRRAMLTI
jgi:hypothetical protein